MSPRRRPPDGGRGLKVILLVCGRTANCVRHVQNVWGSFLATSVAFAPVLEPCRHVCNRSARRCTALKAVDQRSPALLSPNGCPEMPAIPYPTSSSSQGIRAQVRVIVLTCSGMAAWRLGAGRRVGAAQLLPYDLPPLGRVVSLVRGGGGGILGEQCSRLPANIQHVSRFLTRFPNHQPRRPRSSLRLASRTISEQAALLNTLQLDFGNRRILEVYPRLLLLLRRRCPGFHGLPISSHTRLACTSWRSNCKRATSGEHVMVSLPVTPANAPMLVAGPLVGPLEARAVAFPAVLETALHRFVVVHKRKVKNSRPPMPCASFYIHYPPATEFMGCFRLTGAAALHDADAPGLRGLLRAGSQNEDKIYKASSRSVLYARRQRRLSLTAYPEAEAGRGGSDKATTGTARIAPKAIGQILRG